MGENDFNQRAPQDVDDVATPITLWIPPLLLFLQCSLFLTNLKNKEAGDEMSRVEFIRRVSLLTRWSSDFGFAFADLCTVKWLGPGDER